MIQTDEQLRQLLDELESKTAHELEGQELDFKEWDESSMNQSVKKLVEMTICMANGGGGTVVYGVKDDVAGREQCIIGIPEEVDIDKLKRTVHDRTDPTITPEFRELDVPEGTGRVLAVIVHPTNGVFTDTAGKGSVRVGDNCKPLTGSMRRKMNVEKGKDDFTAITVEETVDELLSPTAMEHLREAASREGAPPDFSEHSDRDLLRHLGVILEGRLTHAGLLLAGTDEAIARHIPHYQWTYLELESRTEYSNRVDGQSAIPVAINRIMDRIMAQNPITTVEQGLFHFEYRLYPEIALREALLNAFSHADFRIASPIMVKHSDDSLEITNPGGFVGGISEDNILHHTPIARNPLLVDALVRLRLVNRSNLGVQRMYKALLQQGKEPPTVQGLGDAVKVTFLASEFSLPFRTFIEEESKEGANLSIDHLLVLHYLVRHSEITTSEAARICQRSETRIREVLSEMQMKHEYLDRGGTGTGTYWRLRPEIHERLSVPGEFERHQRIDWETAKTRVLAILKKNAERGDGGLRNKDVRRITSYDRNQANRLLSELRDEGHTKTVGHGRGARWILTSDDEQSDREAKK